MSTPTEIMQQVKTGVEGIMSEQRLLEKRLSDIEQAAGQARRKNFGSLPGVEHYPFSFGKAFLADSAMRSGQAHLIKEWGVGHELEVMQQASKISAKALDTGTAGGGGGFTVPAEVMAEIIEMMRAAAPVVQLGVTVLDGLKGSPVILSKQLAAGSIQWMAQNGTINKSDAAFGLVQLIPKIAAMRCTFSNLLGILSNPKIEDLIRRDIARVLAIEVDRIILEGLGSSNQPQGIANMTGIQTFSVGTNGGQVGWDELTDILGKLEDQNVPGKKLGIAWHPKVKRVLKKQKTLQYSGDPKGAYTVAPFMSDAKLQETLGIPFASTTQITTTISKGSGTNLSRVYAADWSEIILGMWGGIEIMASNLAGDAWATNSVEVRMVANMDVGARHVESIVVCSDAATS